MVGLLALVFRVFGVQRANDVFIDEVTYADIARQIADGQMPSILGTPFFLHPPGTYALNGLVIRVLGLEGHSTDLVLQLRWVNGVLGAVTVVVCFLLVRRLVGIGPAVCGWSHAGERSICPPHGWALDDGNAGRTGCTVGVAPGPVGA